MAQALTKVGSTLTIPGTSNTVSLWLLPNPLANGAGTLTVTTSTSLSIVTYPQLFVNANQAASVDSAGSSASLNNSSGDVTASTTTVTDNALAIGFLGVAIRGDDSAGTGTVSSGFPLILTGSVGINMYQASAIKHPAGSVSLVSSNGNARSVIMQAVGLAPSGGTIALSAEFKSDTPSTGTTHTFSFSPGIVNNPMLVVGVISSGAAPTGVAWQGTMAFFGDTFGTFTIAGILLTFIPAFFGSLFNVVAPSVTTADLWKNLAKDISSWINKTKS